MAEWLYKFIGEVKKVARRWLSPTRIQIWRECHRKWGFQFIDGIDLGETDKQAFGTEMHDHAARWLKLGEPPPNTPTGLAFRQGIRRKFLPAPNRGHWVEVPFNRRITEIKNRKVNLQGTADFMTGPELHDGVRALVIDHKSTSDARYAKTTEDLKTDPQSIIYGKVAMEKFDVDEVEARWIYYVASGPDAEHRKPKGVRIRTVILTKKRINKQWKRVVQDASEMAEAKATVKSAMDLPPNPLACDAYGGCPFRDKCNLTGGQRLAAHLHQFNKVHSPTATHSDIIKALEEVDMAKGSAKKATGLLAKLKNMKGADEEEETPKKKGKKGKKEEPEEEEDEEEEEEQDEEEDEEEEEEEEQDEEEDEEEEEEEEPAPKKKGKKGKSKADARAILPGLVVYFDAIPQKGINPETSFRLMDVLLPAMKTVCRTEKVAHWNFVEFGKGPAALATAFDEVLLSLADDVAENGMVINVDSNTAEARAVVEVLYARAETIVKGVKA